MNLPGMSEEASLYIKALNERVAKLEAAVEALRPVDLGDITSEYNNFAVRKDPKSWLDSGGESYAGKRLSECPPAYLDALASLFEWMARKDEESGNTYVNKKTGEAMPTAPLKRKDAARAKAWAKKLREGGAPTPKAAPQQDAFFDEEPPF